MGPSLVTRFVVQTSLFWGSPLFSRPKGDVWPSKVRTERPQPPCSPSSSSSPVFFAFASDEQRPVLYVSIWAISYQIDKLLNLVSLVFGGYQTPTTCIRALQALKYARVDTFLHYFLMFMKIGAPKKKVFTIFPCQKCLKSARGPCFWLRCFRFGAVVGRGLQGSASGGEKTVQIQCTNRG